MVYDQKLVVFALLGYANLALLQSRAHEYWAIFFGSSLEDRPVYTPSDCFETFPFPPAWETSPALEAAGRAYYDCRTALMVRNHEGLTKTYNRFHDPDNHAPEIVELRRLHDAMDRPVLDAYGWADLQPKCEFLLDYEEEDEPEDDGGKRKAKNKPWRYRWPDPIRDEVLARLLALNPERAKQEALAGDRGDDSKSALTVSRRSAEAAPGTMFD
jgi:hypothetical protein